jgi:universal stress protein A
MKVRRVLVPVDLSSGSLRALDYAIDFGKVFEPQFVVLFVLEPMQFAVDGQVQGTLPVRVAQERRRRARAELAAVTQPIAARGIRVRGVVEEGSPHGAIIDAAKRLKADLIIMGTHGRTGMTRALFGSVAEMVTRHATCPVLTVRPDAIPKRRGGARRPAARRSRQS